MTEPTLTPPSDPGADPEVDTRPWWKKKRYFLPLGTLVALFVIGAIFGEPPEDEDQVATRSNTRTRQTVVDKTTTTQAEDCAAVEQAVLDGIASAGTVSGLSLRDGHAAKLPGQFAATPIPLRYAVAAEVEAAGYEGPGHMGVWLVSGITRRRELSGVLAGNELARQVTDWGSEATEGSPVDQNRDGAMDSDGAKKAEDCAQ